MWYQNPPGTLFFRHYEYLGRDNQVSLWYYYGLGPRVWNFSGVDLLRQTSTKSVELRRSSSSKFRQTLSNFVEVSSPIPTFDINLDHAHSYKYTFLKKQ